VGPRFRLDVVVKRKESYHCPHRELNVGSAARGLVTILPEIHRLHDN